MKYKSFIITLFASSIFLATIICIWKIMATLQGLSFTNLNFNFNLLLSLGLTIISILIGNKFNEKLRVSKPVNSYLCYSIVTSCQNKCFIYYNCTCY